MRMLRSATRLASAALLAGSGAQGQPPERLFYYVDSDAAFASFAAHADAISVIAPQSYTVDSLGVVGGDVDPRVLAIARAHGVRVMPLLVNEGFDAPMLHRLLGDTVALARATRSMADLCRTRGYWGWQLDIEHLLLPDGPRFTAWYRRTAAALHAAGCTLSAAVVHRFQDEAGPTGYDRFLFDEWRGGYDLRALADAGDFITLMMYDEHTRRTPPGPVAALPWVRAGVAYALRNVPRAKLSLGVPLYGDHWFVRADPSIPERARATGESVTWARGTSLAARYGAAIQWDSASAVPFAHWSNGGTWEWEFLEDARSFAAKTALVRELGLRGFSAWVLGQEDPHIWDGLTPRGARTH